MNEEEIEKYKQKEQEGIYDVSFKDKQHTSIITDLEAIENAVIDYVIHYIKGWHNIKRDKGRGAEHIKLHLEPNSQGQITLEELLNLGNSIREYLKIFKEPYKDSNEARIYEWENEENIRFRAVTDMNHKIVTKGEGHSNTPLSPSDEVIITFYSDRNLKKKMEFKNSQVREYYEKQSQNDTFMLCKALVELLGKEGAIANSQRLYQRHPEMFRDKEEIKEVIERVVSEPEIIINNPKAKATKDFIVAKRLDERKMGDVGIRNDGKINVIYHTNKRNIRGFYKLQSLVETPSAKAAPTWSDHCADKSKDLPKCVEAPSTTADDIIPQNKDKIQTRQSSLDSLNERFTQALEEHKQNQRERYDGFQKIENNAATKDSQIITSQQPKRRQQNER